MPQEYTNLNFVMFQFRFCNSLIKVKYEVKNRNWQNKLLVKIFWSNMSWPIWLAKIECLMQSLWKFGSFIHIPWDNFSRLKVSFHFQLSFWKSTSICIPFSRQFCILLDLIMTTITRVKLMKNISSTKKWPILINFSSI